MIKTESSRKLTWRDAVTEVRKLMVLSNISLTDCSTPQRSFLGFIKSTITGDYISYLRHLTDEGRLHECGITDLANVPAEVTNSFFQTVQSLAFTNHVILAYSEAETNLIWHLNSTMQSQKGAKVKTSYLESQLVHTNGEWRISAWDVDE